MKTILSQPVETVAWKELPRTNGRYKIALWNGLNEDGSEEQDKKNLSLSLKQNSEVAPKTNVDVTFQVVAANKSTLIVERSKSLFRFDGCDKRVHLVMYVHWVPYVLHILMFIAVTVYSRRQSF